MDRQLFTAKRIFLNELSEVEDKYTCYDFLHYNPMKRHFLEKIVQYGQLWAVYRNNTMVACSCLFPSDIDIFSSSYARWNTADLLHLPGVYLVRGYIWTEESCTDDSMHRFLYRLWTMTALRSGYKQVLHYSPAHIHTNMEMLFGAEFYLVGLRGLDKLVPHWIFLWNSEEKTQPAKEKSIKKIPRSETKEISHLCEQGFCAIGTDKNGDLIFTDRR